MPMLIACARGCGHPIQVSDDVIHEAQTLGVPLSVSHEAGQCPGSPGKLPEYQYRLRVLVERRKIMHPEDPEEGRVVHGDPEQLIKNGAEVDGDSLSEVFDTLSERLSEQWQKASEMRYLAEQ